MVSCSIFREGVNTVVLRIPNAATGPKCQVIEWSVFKSTPFPHLAILTAIGQRHLVVVLSLFLSQYVLLPTIVTLDVGLIAGVSCTTPSPALKQLRRR